ncbi:MAG: hypothetical protein U9N87_02270 [Planctomycetota bacterium]|nr:hypothetical protein [Planctomycetota bacterium]
MVALAARPTVLLKKTPYSLQSFSVEYRKDVGALPLLSAKSWALNEGPSIAGSTRNRNLDAIAEFKAILPVDFQGELPILPRWQEFDGKGMLFLPVAFDGHRF